MDKRLFPATVKAEEADWNAIHDNTEAAFRAMQNALAGENADNDKLLLQDAEPLLNTPGALEVRVPAQYIAINGIFLQVPQTDISDLTSAGDRDLAIFFRIKKADATPVTRDYLDTSGASPVTGSSTFVMASEDQTVEVEPVDNYTGPGDDPAPVAGEVGIIHYATIEKTGGALSAIGAGSVHDPDSNLWQVPVAVAIAGHGSDHTDGTDDIQTATPLQKGLAAAADIETAQAALTDLTSSTAYLVRTISGDNTVTPASKAVAMEFRAHSEMFESVTESAQTKIGLKFGGSSNLLGSSNSPARMDHQHNLTTSAHVTVFRSFDVASNLDSLSAISIPTTMGTILDVAAYWAPPSVTNFPRALAQWQQVFLTNSTSGIHVGVRWYVAGQQDLRVYLGSAACELALFERDAIEAQVGSINWTSYAGSGTLLPTSGTIFLYITGLRTGVSVLT